MGDTMMPGKRHLAIESGENSMARRRYQRGMVFLRGDKNPVWVGRWREGERVRDNGAPVRIFKSKVIGTKKQYPTKTLAVRALEQELARVNASTYRPGRVASVAWFADEWLRVYVAQRKAATVQSVRGHVNKHLKPLIGHLSLDAVGEREQQLVVNALLQQGLSRKTVLNIIGTLSSMLNTATRWGYIACSVKLSHLSLPTAIRKQPRVLTPEEVAKVIHAAPEQDRAVYATAAMSGLRAGEIFGLQAQDIDLSKGLLHVRRSVWRGRMQTPKSNHSQSTILMAN